MTVVASNQEWRSGAAMAAIGSAVRYCAQLTRQVEYEYYLASRLAPHHRDLICAVRAFNIETGLRRSDHQDAALGRVAFWRECVELICNGSSSGPEIQHPVFKALQFATSKWTLDKYLLKRIMDTRAKDAKAQAYYSMHEVEEYAEGTSSSLLYLLLRALNIHDTQLEHVASHLGKAAGVCDFIKSSKFDHKVIPQDMLHNFGLAQSSWTSADTFTRQEVIYEMTVPAWQHFNEACRLWEGLADDGVKRAARTILLPAGMSIKWNLTNLDNHSYNLADLGFRGSLHSDGWFPLNMFMRVVLGRGLC